MGGGVCVCRPGRGQVYPISQSPGSESLLPRVFQRDHPVEPKRGPRRPRCSGCVVHRVQAEVAEALELELVPGGARGQAGLQLSIRYSLRD